MGVQINMSKSSLTKIITFTPFYLLHNTLGQTVQISEAEQLDQSWMDIGENLFWITHPTRYSWVHTVLSKRDMYGSQLFFKLWLY